ncbi:expressed unknown protein [Seminavis robusta]|uniref:Uncharacterized protein n=1 Tax=Seminavis robusta TaxID=568900 RepID=A0A9N8DK24_9STRA|nr:expressed unknown protein [Seminavis robusta]|eukprot:Sro186_g080750.1 n/a (372) ;mRNA; f:78540-79759
MSEMNAAAPVDEVVEAEPLFYGRWKAEEERYAEMLIQEFRGGNLDIEDGVTLRGYLAKMLNCAPKRISKKFESSGYNGRQQYIGKPATFTPEESKKRSDELEAARLEFEARRKGLAKKKPRRAYTKASKPSATLKAKAPPSSNSKPSFATEKPAAAAAEDMPPASSALAGNMFAHNGGVGLFSNTYLNGLPPGAAAMNYLTASGLPTSALYPAAGLPSELTAGLCLSGFGGMESTPLGASLLATNHRQGLPSSNGRSVISSVEASLLDSILANTATPQALAASSTSASLLGSSNPASFLQQSRMDAATMLAQARHDAEQRALLAHHIADQRKRLHSALSAETGVNRRASIDPPVQGDGAAAEQQAKRFRYM